MTTHLDLASSYLFTQKINAVILFLVFVVSLVWNDFPLSILSICAYCFIFIILMVVVCRPQKMLLQYLTFREGDIGNCMGFNTAKDSVGFVLSEPLCRISGFGCWLVFIPTENQAKQTFIWQYFRQDITVFVPKHLVSLSQYKSLCRHLIWHATK